MSTAAATGVSRARKTFGSRRTNYPSGGAASASVSHSVTEEPKINRNLALELLRVTEAGALAAAPLQGRGNKEAADRRAVEAIRESLTSVDMRGTVVIGEGEKDEAPMLYFGESIGNGLEPEVDVAIDPIEGTSLTASGRPGPISAVAPPDGGRRSPTTATKRQRLVVAR